LSNIRIRLWFVPHTIYPYSLSSIVVFLIACTAIKRSFNVKLPTIPRLPYLMTKFSKKNNSILESILLPFGVLIYNIYKTFHLIVDAMWRLIASISYYVYAFVKNFISYLINLLINKKILINLCKVLASLFLVILFAKFVRYTTPALYGYLVSSVSWQVIFSKSFIPLLKICAFFFFSLIGISFYRCIWLGFKEWHDAMDRAAISGTTIFLSCFFTGFLSHIVNRFTPIKVTGFDLYGPFFIIVGCMMAILTVYVFFRPKEGGDSNQ